MPDVCLLLGSNIEPRLSNLRFAAQRLSEDYNLVKVSDVIESEPWGMEGASAFLNVALLIQTQKSAEELMTHCLHIEKEAGRERQKGRGYQSRILDCDILFYGEEVIQTSEVTIPHPRLHLRRFALIPLKQVAPLWRHPVLHSTSVELLNNCKDEGWVRQWPQSLHPFQ